jgi:hypothetical protein
VVSLEPAVATSPIEWASHADCRALAVDSINRLGGRVTCAAMTFPAQVLPRRPELAQSTDEEVLKALSAKCKLLDVVQNSLFVFHAGHKPRLEGGRDVLNPTVVPNG